MNNKKNQYLEMFLSIADELLENQYIKSRRDFSSRYLNRCSNYIGSLVWQNKPPSVATILTLYFNLNQRSQLPKWQDELLKTIKETIIKEKK